MTPLGDQGALRDAATQALASANSGKPPVPLFQVLFNHANNYSVGGQILLQSAQETKNAGLLAPALLSDSFAVELLLKCFIVLPHPTITAFADLRAAGVSLKGHRYSDLFGRIAPEYQAQVAMAFTTLTGVPTDAPGFRERLLEIGDEPFVEWRYVYEDGESHFVSVELFRFVLDALGVTAQNEIRRLLST